MDKRVRLHIFSRIKRMTTFCILLSLAVFALPGPQIPRFMWALQVGSGVSDPAYGHDRGKKIVTDDLGNVYVVGRCAGGASHGRDDVYIAKFDSAGNKIWALQEGGNGADGGYGLAVDSSYNVFVAGFFTGQAHFGPFTLQSSGRSDIFVAKYDVSGSLVWVTQDGGASVDYGDEAYDVALDRDGYVWVTGYFSGTWWLGGLDYLVANGIGDVFVAKYDAGGTLQDVIGFGGNSAGYGTSIAADDPGNIYVAGFFRGDLGLDGLQSSGGYDVFVVKFPSDGPGWAAKAGGIDDDGAYGIDVDSAGSVLVATDFRGEATYGGTVLTSRGDSDICLAMYDPDGNLIATHQAGGSQADHVEGVSFDGQDNFLVTGFINDTATFGTESLTGSGQDLFIVKYASDGSTIWAKRAGLGTSGTSQGSGVVKSRVDNSIFITGHFSGTYGFDDIVLYCGGFEDLLIAQLKTIKLPGGGGVFGDFDGDGKADATVTRAGSLSWYALLSGTPGAWLTRSWGTDTDEEVIGDYDGDGTADIAVWRPERGTHCSVAVRTATYRPSGGWQRTDRSLLSAVSCGSCSDLGATFRSHGSIGPNKHLHSRESFLGKSCRVIVSPI